MALTVLFRAPDPPSATDKNTNIQGDCSVSSKRALLGWQIVRVAMQKKSTPPAPAQDSRSENMALFNTKGPMPEGALISGDTAEDGRIAVIYNQGETPPVITIAGSAQTVQTILANGVAVAVVANVDGPRLTANDVMLVERFVG